MSDEAKAAEAGKESGSGKVAPTFVAESVRKAIETVTGEGGAAETTPTKETKPTEKPTEKAGDAGEEKESQAAKGAGEAAEDSVVLKGDDLKKYMHDTPLWDLDLKKLPEELRDVVKPMKKKITKDFQFVSDEKRKLESKKTDSTKTDTTKETGQRGGEKQLTRDELYALAFNGDPEGFEKAMETYVAQFAPKVVEKITRDEARRQSEYMESQQQLTVDAIENLTESIKELESDEFKEAVATVIERNPRISARIASAKTIEDMEDALELAARKARENWKPKQPADPKAQDKKERERANAGEKGSIASRKGSKVGTADEGPMTVAKSVQLAKERVARGDTVV